MTKWEYLVRDLDQPSIDQTVILNHLAEKGWELVTVTEVSNYCPKAYLKRKVKA